MVPMNAVFVEVMVLYGLIVIVMVLLMTVMVYAVVELF